MNDILIVGAGHAGTQLAASLREAGHTGSIALISAENDLPYHRPPLSKSFMKSADTPLQGLRAAAFFDNKSIQLHLGASVEQIHCAERALVLDSGQTLRYEQLVLATGASARTLQVPGIGLNGVFQLRTANDARQLRSALPQADTAVVIGGGFIGLEAAATLVARGLSVTVVELEPNLLGRAVSTPMAQSISEYLMQLGVDLCCNAGVKLIEGKGGAVAAVHLSDDRAISADLVIVGVGAVPEIALASQAGLATDNGIQVDEWLRTSDPHIYAVGDCAAFPLPATGIRKRLESVQNATDHARALAATLTGTPTPYRALPWFWSDIGELRLQIAGLADGTDELISSHIPEGRINSVYRFKAGRLLAVETLDSTGEHMLARKLIQQGLTPPRELMQAGDLAGLKAFYQAQQPSAE